MPCAGRQSERGVRQTLAQQITLGLEESGKLTPHLRLLLQILGNRLLHRGRDGEGIELVHASQFQRQRRGRDAVPDAPAGGVQGLAKREHHEGAWRQFGMRQHRVMLAPVIHDVLVDLIGQHQDVPITDQGRERIQIRAVATVQLGLCGELMMIRRVRGVMLAATRSQL